MKIKEKIIFDLPQIDLRGPLLVAMYPNKYGTGMSNIGYQMLLPFFRMSGFFVERFFALSENNYSLKTFESNFNLKKAQVIAISLAFEMDIFNLVKVLYLSGINPLASERTDNDPIILIGGPVVMANPKILFPIADIIYRGHLEAIDINLFITLSRFLKKSRNRIEARTIFNNAPGFWVYDNKSIPESSFLRKSDLLTAHSYITSNKLHFGDGLLIEVIRSCPFKCKFCLVHYCTGPVIKAKPDFVIDLAIKSKDKVNFIGLVGATVFSHPDIISIVKELVKLKFRIGFSSLRTDFLDDDILKLILQAKEFCLTIAPETPDETYRKILGKNISNYNIHKIIINAAKLGFKQLKLYFVLGLPYESPCDYVEKFNSVKLWCRDFLKNGGKNVKISFSIFVPKSGTPYSLEPFSDLITLKSIIKDLKILFSEEHNIKLFFENPEESLTQSILSIGDERVGLSVVDKIVNSMKFEKALKKNNFDLNILFHKRKI